MNKNALVGYTGFVGSNLVRQFRFDHLYNSKNIEDIANSEFEYFVFSGAQAKKWWANENPQEDWQGIERALDAIASVRATHPILISTIDVLPAPQDVSVRDETADCYKVETHPYGLHRLKLEASFRDLFPKATIVRLPGLFGDGLKKNVLFDLMNDNILDKINPASSFQYYDLSRLWEDIQTALAAELELVHLFTEPVKTADIHQRFFAEKQIGSDPFAEAHYDYHTRFASVFGGRGCYIESAASVLDRMARFISNQSRTQ